MARSEQAQPYFSLDKYRKWFRIPAWAFNGVENPDETKKGCDHYWTQWERDDLAQALDDAEKLLATQLGFYLGIGAAVTWPRAQRLRGVVASLPLERLLLESDAPDQPPCGRDPPNEPAFVRDTLNVLAGLRGVESKVVAAQTWQNAASLFGVAGEVI